MHANVSGAARIFYWRGKIGQGLGRSPRKFSKTTPSTLAIDATSALFKD